METNYDTVIGLEIHVQLNTNSKAFCRDKNKFGTEPNSNVSPVSLALPGTLPMLNRAQVISAIKLGIALDSTIEKNGHFDRKNYFYPDLPKGYQITQDLKPICIGGQFTFKTGNGFKTIRMHHIHMEEDAGKSIHDMDPKLSLIDLNRAGTPLLEIVTEPDFTTGQEVSDFIGALQILLRYIDISDANMEQGSLRCDCNVSVKPQGQIQLGTRCEIKNVNSKKFAKQAINFERERQIELITAGESITQETRLYDTSQGKTYSMRKKEDALDYRYFPDPDMQTIVLQNELIENIKNSIDFLPWEAERKLINTFNISESNAMIIAANKEHVYFFMQLAEGTKNNTLVSNFFVNQLIPSYNRINSDQLEDVLQSCNALLNLIENKKISTSTAYKSILPEIIKTPQLDVLAYANEEGLLISENQNAGLSLCQEIIDANPEKREAYINGQKGLFGFFMGEAMKSGIKGLDPKELKNEFDKLLNQ